MLERSKVEEHDGHQSDREMIEILRKAQQTLAATLGGLGELAADHGGTLTEDLTIERGRTHEKFAWMRTCHALCEHVGNELLRLENVLPSARTFRRRGAPAPPESGLGPRGSASGTRDARPQKQAPARAVLPSPPLLRPRLGQRR